MAHYEKNYWYKSTLYYCPHCRSENVVKTRQETEKPDNWIDRLIFVEKYDYCNKRELGSTYRERT